MLELTKINDRQGSEVMNIKGSKWSLTHDRDRQTFIARRPLPIVNLARRNHEFRKVLWTGDKTQLVLMAIPEGGKIGGEMQEGHDQ
jgi:hypothetical protein